jgi:methylthioribose-1-phosphate isomerase
VIRIEERSRDELSIGGAALPDAVTIRNPAFDVTPAELITAIITDLGVHRPPYAFPAAWRAVARGAAGTVPR